MCWKTLSFDLDGRITLNPVDGEIEITISLWYTLSHRCQVIYVHVQWLFLVWNKHSTRSQSLHGGVVEVYVIVYQPDGGQYMPHCNPI